MQSRIKGVMKMAITKAIYLQEETWKRLEQIQRRWERTISISNLIEMMVKDWFANYNLKMKQND